MFGREARDAGGGAFVAQSGAADAGESGGGDFGFDGLDALRVARQTQPENVEYRFVSERADNATRKYGVKSVSLLAVKR